jgi:hypothetical protein
MQLCLDGVLVSVLARKVRDSDFTLEPDNFLKKILTTKPIPGIL